jgi:predicted Zn-dependent protease
MPTVVKLLLVAALAACSTVPYTGRKQLSLLPSSQLSAMGEQAFLSMLRQAPTVSDPKVVDYIGCVAKPIVQVFREKHAGKQNWKLAVFRDETPNAFVLPGGNIGVNAGILKVAKTDAQLAAVLGHELGHELANHAGERVSQQLLATIGLAGAQVYLQGRTQARETKLILAALGLGAQIGVLLPFGRKQESEADTIGLNLMSQAGFDPGASVSLWSNMHEMSRGKEPPVFLSTHPSSKSRMEALRAQVPQFEKSPVRRVAEKSCQRPSEPQIAAAMGSSVIRLGE